MPKKNNNSVYHQEGVEAAWAKKDPASCLYADEERKSIWYQGFDAAKKLIFRSHTNERRN